MHQILSVVLCLMLSFSITTAGHYFPWKLISGRELTIGEACAYGIWSIVLPPVVIMSLVGNAASAGMLALSALAVVAAIFVAAQLGVRSKVELNRLHIYAICVVAMAILPLLSMAGAGSWVDVAMVVMSITGATLATVGSKMFDGYLEMKHEILDQQDKLAHAAVRTEIADYIDE